MKRVPSVQIARRRCISISILSNIKLLYIYNNLICLLYIYIIYIYEKIKNLKVKGKDSYQAVKEDRTKTDGGTAIDLSAAETELHEVFGSITSFGCIVQFITSSTDLSKKGK